MGVFARRRNNTRIFFSRLEFPQLLNHKDISKQRSTVLRKNESKKDWMSFSMDILE